MSYVNRRVAKRMSNPAFAQVWKESELEDIISRYIIKKEWSVVGLNLN